MAKKLDGYLIEPQGSNLDWQSHHTTNPTVFRADGREEVFLGYRAGGHADHYWIPHASIWGSHLGLALLTPNGRQVDVRFPLPIMRLLHDVALPQNEDEYQEFASSPEAEQILVLHDFRFWVDQSWLYVIYHEGSLTRAVDAIVRMRIEDFLQRVDQSKQLLNNDFAIQLQEWEKMWWQEGIWEPAGIDGTKRLYRQETPKNDIVFLRLNNDDLMMYHRPLPNIAKVKTDGRPFAPELLPGIDHQGVLENSIRPGCFDNSHIGNNGVPIPVKVGNRTIFMDVVHGVHNEHVTKQDQPGWKLTYLPYVRLLDGDTGDTLYYADQPVLENDNHWKEYVEQGAWIKDIPHLDACMFAGGQIPENPRRNAIHDPFLMYMGLGDTAIGIAVFKLNEVIPPSVVEGLQEAEEVNESCHVITEESAFQFALENTDWRWSINNTPKEKCIEIKRTLVESKIPIEDVVRIKGRFGFFDQDGVWAFSTAIMNYKDCLWIVPYGASSRREGELNIGLMFLEYDCPEKIYYRSDTPLGSLKWPSDNLNDELHALVVSQLENKWRKTLAETEFIRREEPMPCFMKTWLRNVSSLRTQKNQF